MQISWKGRDVVAVYEVERGERLIRPFSGDITDAHVFPTFHKAARFATGFTFKSEGFPAPFDAELADRAGEEIAERMWDAVTGLEQQRAILVGGPGLRNLLSFAPAPYLRRIELWCKQPWHTQTLARRMPGMVMVELPLWYPTILAIREDGGAALIAAGYDFHRGAYIFRGWSKVRNRIWVHAIPLALDWSGKVACDFKALYDAPADQRKAMMRSIFEEQIAPFAADPHVRLIQRGFPCGLPGLPKGGAQASIREAVVDAHVLTSNGSPKRMRALIQAAIELAWKTSSEAARGRMLADQEFLLAVNAGWPEDVHDICYHGPKAAAVTAVVENIVDWAEPNGTMIKNIWSNRQSGIEMGPAQLRFHEPRLEDEGGHDAFARIDLLNRFLTEEAKLPEAEAQRLIGALYA